MTNATTKTVRVYEFMSLFPKKSETNIDKIILSVAVLSVFTVTSLGHRLQNKVDLYRQGLVTSPVASHDFQVTVFMWRHKVTGNCIQDTHKVLQNLMLTKAQGDKSQNLMIIKRCWWIGYIYKSQKTTQQVAGLGKRGRYFSLIIFMEIHPHEIQLQISCILSVNCIKKGKKNWRSRFGLFNWGEAKFYKVDTSLQDSIFCRVPTRRGLRRTALAPGRDETRAVNPLVRKQINFMGVFIQIKLIKLGVVD